MRKLILLTFLTFAITAKSQEVKSLTLKEAINYALENKADAKKAKLKVENSNYQIQEVRSRALPQITANGSLNYNPILQTTVIDGAAFGQPGTVIQAAFGQKWSSTAGLSLTQALFDQTVSTGLKAAKSTREFYQINNQLTEEQVIERVANNYYQVYVQRQNLTVIDSTYKNTTKVRDIIKGQYDNGLAKKIDLDRVSVKISNINTMRQQVLNAVQIQENALKFYMGMPIENKIELVKADMEITPHLLDETVATDQRSEIKILNKQRELLQYNKKAVEAAYYPTVNLNANYSWQGLGDKFPLTNGEKNGVYWADYSAITLGVNIPIFNGFATKARVEMAQIELDKLDVSIKDTKLGLDLSYQNAKSQIENSLLALENQKANVSLAETVTSNTKHNYQYGLANLTELLEAENALVEAKNNYSNAILEYKIAEIQYYKAKGELKNYIK